MTVGLLDADCEEAADAVPDCAGELDCADVDCDGDADVCADPPVVSLAQPTARARTAAAAIHLMFAVTDDHTFRQLDSAWAVATVGSARCG